MYIYIHRIYRRMALEAAAMDTSIEKLKRKQQIISWSRRVSEPKWLHPCVCICICRPVALKLASKEYAP